jgi:putative Holliday junction resolvase
MSGRIAGIDPGERRIGVALSDPLGIIASPLTVLDRREGDVFQALRGIFADRDVATVVVGLPVGLRGDEGRAAEQARAFGRQVEEECDVDVVYHDERFTSVMAEAALLEGGRRRAQRREVRDKVAASIMLQGFLDARSAGES